MAFNIAGRAQAQAEVIAAKEERKAAPSGYQREGVTERFVKNMASTMARSLGNALIRGILGGLTRR